MIQPLLVPAQLLLMPDLKVPATIGTMKMRLIWGERASIGQRANRNFNANGVATHSPRERIILGTVQAIAGAAKLSEILQVLNLISENKQTSEKQPPSNLLFLSLHCCCLLAKKQTYHKKELHWSLANSGFFSTLLW